ncbi:MAG: DUF2075 domain-containing protein [Eggerthellaceae bacterium]|nr:DUF2075 domain-containing protein [Eggerthellaceae bacterium]
MLVYDGLKEDFLTDVVNDEIAQKIYNSVLEKLGRHTGRAEFESWNNSMQYMYKVLIDQDIPSDCGIAIEYNLPQTSKRIDFIVSGYDEKGNGHANIIELKQWQELDAILQSDGLVRTFTGGAMRTVSHPSYQAWSYAQVLYDYSEILQNDSIKLHPCAYLHNYVRKGDDDPLFNSHYRQYLDAAPAFIAGDVPKLRSFIKADIVAGDKTEVVHAIDSGKIKPSKSLQDALVKMLKGNREFTLLDDQKVTYEWALYLSRKCAEDGKKRVFVVKGGPGTGKSVVAINLLCQLTSEGQIVQYVSKNSAPRNVYAAKLRGDFAGKYIGGLFKGSGSYVDTPRNSLNTLIVDEAHRLNEKSGLFQNLGENQVKEIINAAQCSVFFIDEHQRVTTKDIGSVALIREYAEQADAEVFEDQLLSQFRCNGSDGYLSWVDNTLEIGETANTTLEGIDFDFRVFDTPGDMQKLVEARNASNKARILAGYCWDWPAATRNDPTYFDIKIGDWGISWNLDDTQTYAIDQNSVHEAGCIHTTQGLEFDYVGVIIGDDMRFENGHVVTDFSKRAKTDQSIKGLKTRLKHDREGAVAVADEIIRNTYRTLLTRGMKGCYVYCVDEALGKYLKESMGPVKYGLVGL